MSQPETVRGGAARRLRLVAPTPLRVVDVALVYGSRGGFISSHLERKAAWARDSLLIDHHVVVPGRVPGHTHAGWRRELASLRLALPRGHRVTLGLGPLEAALRALRPEVVLLHGALFTPPRIVRVAHEIGAVVVAVRHDRWPRVHCRSAAARVVGRVMRAWTCRLEADVDAVMSAATPFEDAVARLEHLVGGFLGRGERLGSVAVPTPR